MSDDQRTPTTAAQARYRIVSLNPEDAARMAALEETVWFEVFPGASPDDLVETFNYDQGRGVEAVASPPAALLPDSDPKPLAGIYGVYEMTLSVPAPGVGVTRVPMSGLSWVGVHPDHRRQGVLRTMMTDHLHRLHSEGGAAIAGLWASEVEIYGRYGYGPAGLDVTVTVSRGTDLRAPAQLQEAAEAISTYTTHASGEASGAAIHAVQVAAAASTLGSATRPEEIATLWFRDMPKARGTKEPRQVLFAVREGQPVGYAVFRRTPNWTDHNMPDGSMVVAETAATDPAVLLALTQRLLDFDLIGKVTFHGRSTDDPLVWWAGGPRSGAMRVSDGLWVRLVDLSRAMMGRGYAASCDVVMGVRDELCPWNAGSWRLSVGADGVGTCSATEARPDLELDVQALGSAYLGGRSVASQAAAGLVTEHRTGAVAELSRAMRADTEPMGTSEF